MVRRRSSLQDSQITARYWEMNLPSYDKQMIKYVFLRYIYMHICWSVLITISRVILTLGLFFFTKTGSQITCNDSDGLWYNSGWLYIL